MPIRYLRQSQTTRWLALIAFSAAIGALLATLHISAALLIGPMAAAIVLALLDAGVTVPKPAYVAAQAIVGCMIAGVLHLDLLRDIAASWPLFLFAVTSVITAACGLGVLLTRLRVLPGNAALWGSFPGAAATMTIMAEAYGADIRLVAFMQYLRVLMVALVATIVAHVFAGPVAAAPPVAPAIEPFMFATTLALALFGGLAGLVLRLPAGPLLVPMLLGALLQNLGLVRIELPQALLAIAYAIVGWSIGLRFTREILAHVAYALPRVVASILALIAGCALFATALVVFYGIDPLTAYLAMSPGGADSVAIIAASSNKVDMPFVMALQVSRFLVILAIGPSLARFIAKRLGRTDSKIEDAKIEETKIEGAKTSPRP